MDRTLYIDGVNACCKALGETMEMGALRQMLLTLRNNKAISQSEFETLCEAYC